MSKIPTRRKAGTLPACLQKTAYWLPCYPRAVELLTVAGLFILEVGS